MLWGSSEEPAMCVQVADAERWRPGPSTADLVLTGHTAPAEYALATSASSDPCVASGGQDKQVEQ